MSTLELCEKFFNTRDLYKLLELQKDALPKDIKKAYYKASLKVHPDRVSDAEKAAATEKFKVLSKVYQVLADKDKRTLYDEQGIIDDEDDVEGKLATWLDLWRKVFKPLTEEDINNYEKSYVGSDLERRDIKNAYLLGKGCINRMMNEVPFMKVEDEPRIQKIVQEMIAADEVPEYKLFTHEPSQKRNRRHKKYERESKEAEQIKKKLKSQGSLEQQIIERQQSRQTSFDALVDDLLAKYGGKDDSSTVDFSVKKNKAKSKKNSNDMKESAAELNRVKSGRIRKQKK